MMDRRRSGSWWLPDDPSRRVIGTVTRDGDAWRVELVGTLRRTATQDHDRLAFIPQATVFGMCKGVPLTLTHCYVSYSSSPRGPLPREEVRDDQFSEVWTGSALIEDGHVTDETLYTAAACEFTGLDAVWPMSGMTGLARMGGEYKAPPPLDVDCGNGLSLRISTGANSTLGRHLTMVEEFVRFSVRADGGMSLREITEDILGPVRMLMAINFARPVEWFNLALKPSSGDPDCWVKVDPEVRTIAPEPGALTRRDAAFDAGRIDIGPVLVRWLDLARVSIIPMAVAEPHGRRAMLQNEVVEMVNAAETLHRTRHVDDADSTFATRVKEALQQLEPGRLNYEERRKVVSAVAVREITLERRLQQLAGDLGPRFCKWFFDDQMLNWAFVSSALRNALSHGYHTKHNLEKDTSALIAVHQVTRSVVQLNLLVAAGLPTDGPLVDLLRDNYHFRFIKNQAVLDWTAAAAAMRPPMATPDAS